MIKLIGIGIKLIGVIKQARPFSTFCLDSLSPDFSRSSRALFSRSSVASLALLCLLSLRLSLFSLSRISLFTVPAHGGGG